MYASPVSMPAYLAPLVGFSLGVLFSWAASDELARSAAPLGGTRSMAIVVLFAFLIYGPFSGYFLTYATDWSLAYLLDGRRIPSALLLLWVVADTCSVPLGFAVAAIWARQRRFVALLPLGSVPLAVAALGVAALAHRLAVTGSYAQFGRRMGLAPLAGSAVGYAVLWFHVCLLAGVSWTVRELRAPGAPRRG